MELTAVPMGQDTIWLSLLKDHIMHSLYSTWGTILELSFLSSLEHVILKLPVFIVSTLVTSVSLLQVSTLVECSCDVVYPDRDTLSPGILELVQASLNPLHLLSHCIPVRTLGLS
eukprot:NODE_328_length_10919_cov_0.472828.p10 type:complete len:115 gc:universal NODE_328_length_10919_cov_0.472828:1689-2033(+)